MPDMLVRLYALPNSDVWDARSARTGATIRRVEPGDCTPLRAFVEQAFGVRWADAIGVALSRTPIAAYLALVGGEIVGFALYDVAHPGSFGPMGVREDHRGRGIGASLLMRSLESMWNVGYGYAVIMGVGPAEFYTKVCGATLIAEP